MASHGQPWPAMSSYGQPWLAESVQPSPTTSSHVQPCICPAMPPMSRHISHTSQPAKLRQTKPCLASHPDLGLSWNALPCPVKNRAMSSHILTWLAKASHVQLLWLVVSDSDPGLFCTALPCPAIL